MKCALLPLGLLAMAMVAHAQQQEEGMLGRIDSKWKKGLQAMNSGSKSDTSLVNPMQSQKFGGGEFSTKKYDAPTFQGTKSAGMKTFETRSFFGIKNPWFGRKVFDTRQSSIAGREASEASRENFQATAYAVNEYGKAGKKDALDANALLPNSARPRKYLGPEQPSKRQGIDKFTQNLHKDLSIDDVRDLLNKGKGSR
jgi:hypothetical protein